VEIMAQPFFDARVSTPSMDLCVARKARTYKVAKVIAGMFQPKFAGEFRTLRPRPDETHVAAQNVPELRKLVQSEAAKIVTDSRAARVVRHGPNGA